MINMGFLAPPLTGEVLARVLGRWIKQVKEVEDII